MSQDPFQRVRQLVNDKRYDEAAAILRLMPDDPQAKKWLSQMEARGLIAPSMPEPSVDDLSALRAEVAERQQVIDVPRVPREQARSGSLFRVIVGLALVLLIALQGAMLYVLMSNGGPVEIKQPVSVQGVVSVEAEENNEEVAGALAVEQGLQEWEVLKVEESFLGFLLNDVGIAATDAQSMGEYLDELGGQGWELVTVGYYETGSASYGYTVHSVAFLKRPFASGNVAPATQR